MTDHFQKILSTKNIIIDTVYLLENFFNLKFNVEIILTKNLPVSSGMGGGSSNAATVFYSLKKLYNLKIKKDLTNLLLWVQMFPFVILERVQLLKVKVKKISFS